MKISTKLRLSSIAMAALAFVFVLTTISFSFEIRRSFEKDQAVGEIIKASFQMALLRSEYSANPNERSKSQWASVYASLLTKLNEVEALFTQPTERVVLDRILKATVESEALFRQLVVSTEQKGGLTVREEVINQMTARSEDRFLDANRLAKISREYVTTGLWFFQLTTFVMGLAIVFAFIIYYSVSRSTVRSLQSLAEDFQRVSNLDFSVEDLNKSTEDQKFGDDELGRIKRAFSVMEQKLRGSYGLLQKRVEEKTAELEKQVAVIGENNRYLEQVKIATMNLLEDLETTRGKLLEEKIKDEAILSSIGDGILVGDREGVVVLINNRAEDLIGHKAEEIIGKKLLDAVPMEYETGEKMSSEDSPFRRALVFKTRVEILPLVSPIKTPYMIRKNGKKFPVEIIVTPVIIDDEPVGVVGVFRDITREKEIERVKTEFVSIASHQLRTPLSTINWYSEILLSGDAGKVTDAQKDYLMEIYKGNQRMIDLVNALLNVSRLEVGAFIIESKQINPKDVIKDVINELKPQILKKDINVAEEYPEPLPLIYADYSLTRIIFQNLLSNAVKYTPDKGRVAVKILLDKDKMTFVVSDTGMGIPREQQDKIFTKLFRGDNAREVDPDGTGLGLYIVKSILDQTNGKIRFESVEGKGTSFYIEVPLQWMASKMGTRRLV